MILINTNQSPIRQGTLISPSGQRGPIAFLAWEHPETAMYWLLEVIKLTRGFKG